MRKGYHTDLHVDIFGQALDCISFSCREITCKILAVYFIDMPEMADVAEQDGGLYYMTKVHVCR